jgi:hypothetical protein
LATDTNTVFQSLATDTNTLFQSMLFDTHFWNLSFDTIFRNMFLIEYGRPWPGTLL